MAVPSGQSVPASAYVLVVDDDPGIGGMMHDLLSEEGYAFTIARTGAEALARAPDMPPALILLDRSLLNEPTRDVAAALRARAGWGAVPLALFTGGDKDEVADLAQELGADAVVAKPFNVVDLLAVLERYLAPSRPPSAMPPAND
jgi:DNA-binding response OmpR family regulator